jgi:hypothetical protein
MVKLKLVVLIKVGSLILKDKLLLTRMKIDLDFSRDENGINLKSILLRRKSLLKYLKTLTFSSRLTKVAKMIPYTIEIFFKQVDLTFSTLKELYTEIPVANILLTLCTLSTFSKIRQKRNQGFSILVRLKNLQIIP